MDEAEAKFVGEDQPSDLTFVIAEFPTAPRRSPLSKIFSDGRASAAA
jgi:hypothetical protein